MTKTGIILLCHGSRGEKALKDLPVTMHQVVTGVTAMLPGDMALTWGALQFNTPTLEESAELLIARGVSSVVIVPYFLFSGRHIEEDIPEIMETLAVRYPDVSFTLAPSLGEGELFVPQVVDHIRDFMPELWLETPAAADPPEAIEHRSMDIIEHLLPEAHALSEGEKAVVKRVIHASGDPQTAGLLRFSRGAVEAGVDALKSGSPIITDVRMVAAGINRRSAESCGCPVICALDEAAGASDTGGAPTRAAAAVRQIRQQLNGAVVAIGNAPTALLEMLKLVDEEDIGPALVVGMPVGFVQAAESKEALLRRPVPYVTVTGTRGGSAMAVATVNAMLKLALA